MDPAAFRRRKARDRNDKVVMTWEAHMEGLKKFPEQITPFMWKLFVQEDIIIPPRGEKYISNRFGVKLNHNGSVFISLANHIKAMRVSIENEVISEDTPDIFFVLRNNSDVEVKIDQFRFLCYVSYVNTRYQLKYK